MVLRVHGRTDRSIFGKRTLRIEIDKCLWWTTPSSSGLQCTLHILIANTSDSRLVIAPTLGIRALNSVDWPRLQDYKTTNVA